MFNGLYTILPSSFFVCVFSFLDLRFFVAAVVTVVAVVAFAVAFAAVCLF